MILDIIKEIKADSSKNAKIAILKEHKDNELLKKALVACYDPNVQYYIRKIPDYAPGRTGGTLPLGDAIDSLSRLSSREFTGNAAADFLAKILENVSEDDAQIIERIIDKSMDAGFTGSTVNKVWPKLIPDYPCLLAKSCDEKTIKRMSFPAFSQLKADGMRINAHIVNGNVHLCGRSGKTVDLLGELDADLLEIARCIPIDNLMFDGELVVEDDDGSIMSRKKGNGILNKGIKGTISQKEASRVRIRLWDVISQEAFRAERDETEYYIRFNLVKAAMAVADAPKADLIETIIVQDIAEAQAHFKKLLKQGEEGTLLKSFDHAWEDKRSYGLLKMKAIQDADLEVIDWVPGEGKYEGILGALVCQSSDGKVVVSIGSGFSDEQRLEFTRDNTVGKIVEVLYNERITKKDGGPDSLFLPRFVELREDKDVANSNAEIK